MIVKLKVIKSNFKISFGILRWFYWYISEKLCKKCLTFISVFVLKYYRYTFSKTRIKKYNHPKYETNMNFGIWVTINYLETHLNIPWN